MKLQTSEIAKITGISVRTLHYYDEIGLLKPTQTTQAGYRFYGEAALERLQQILFFKELDFSLKEIADIIKSPNYDKSHVLTRQRELLVLKKQRLERIITAVEKSLEGDSIFMEKDFKAFDTKQIEQAKKAYQSEVIQRYGGTKQFAQSEEKTKSYTKQDWEDIGVKASSIFEGFATLVGGDPAGDDAQILVGQWQQYISDNFYDCTTDILACLGEMYIGDDRFKQNIDQYKEGTAQFMSEAIKIFCGS